FADVVVTGTDANYFLLYPGKGNGTFSSPLTFGPTGSNPSFIIAADLDDDGHLDVITADAASSTLSVFWGKQDSRFLESTFTVTGFTSPKALAIADLDTDGWPDLLFPSSTVSEVEVYQKARSAASKPTLTVDTTSRFDSLEAVDL